MQEENRCLVVKERRFEGAPWRVELEHIRQGLIHYRARYPHPTPGGHWVLLHYHGYRNISGQTTFVMC